MTSTATEMYGSMYGPEITDEIYVVLMEYFDTINHRSMKGDVVNETMIHHFMEELKKQHPDSVPLNVFGIFDLNNATLQNTPSNAQNKKITLQMYPLYVKSDRSWKNVSDSFSVDEKESLERCCFDQLQFVQNTGQFGGEGNSHDKAVIDYFAEKYGDETSNRGMSLIEMAFDHGDLKLLMRRSPNEQIPYVNLDEPSLVSHFMVSGANTFIVLKEKLFRMNEIGMIITTAKLLDSLMNYIEENAKVRLGAEKQWKRLFDSAKIRELGSEQKIANYKNRFTCVTMMEHANNEVLMTQLIQDIGSLETAGPAAVRRKLALVKVVLHVCCLTFENVRDGSWFF